MAALSALAWVCALGALFRRRANQKAQVSPITARRISAGR